MGGVRSMFLPSCSSLLIFLSPLGERLGEGVNPKIVSCITPSPRLSPKGERSMRAEDHEAETDEPDPEAINPIPPFCRMLSGAASSRDAHHQTSLFHRPGIQLRACESLRHVARRRLSPPGRAGRGRDRRRRARHRRGVRQSACDAGIFPHGRADVHRPERVRLRPCRGPHPQRDVPSGRRQPAHRLPGRDQRGALRRHCPRLRRARLRPDRRLRHDADPGLRLDRLLLQRSRAAARSHAGRGGFAIPMPAPRSRSAAASGTTSSACARRARRWGRTSS